MIMEILGGDRQNIKADSNHTTVISNKSRKKKVEKKDIREKKKAIRAHAHEAHHKDA